MDDYDVAVYIVGYRRRVNEHMRSLRQSSFWNMLPHVKTGSLENAISLGALPDEGGKDTPPVMDRSEMLAKMSKSWGDI